MYLKMVCDDGDGVSLFSHNHEMNGNIYYTFSVFLVVCTIFFVVYRVANFAPHRHTHTFTHKGCVSPFSCNRSSNILEQQTYRKEMIANWQNVLKQGDNHQTLSYHTHARIKRHYVMYGSSPFFGFGIFVCSLKPKPKPSCQ